jgi:hypothetical protein
MVQESHEWGSIPGRDIEGIFFSWPPHPDRLWEPPSFLWNTRVYQKVSGLSHNEIKTINTRWEATQRFRAAKLTRLTHKISIQLHLLADSCTICSSCSRRPVRKLLDTRSI